MYLWAVHGGQVMAFVYIGPAVEAEFDDDDAWLLRLSGSFFFAGWIAGLGLWGETSHTLTLDLTLTPWIAGPRPLGLAQLSDPDPNPSHSHGPSPYPCHYP